MNIPKTISDRIAIIKSQIRAIETEANNTVMPLKAELATIEFTISEFVTAEKLSPLNIPPINAGYNYDKLVELLRMAPPEGLPRTDLHIDHPSHLSVLVARKLAKKLPSGNWVAIPKEESA